jgi:hypothetical protein
MLFTYDFFSQGIIKKKFLLIINYKVLMCHKSLKVHISRDSKTMTFKQYFIIRNAILLVAFCGVLEQSVCPFGSKKDQRDNVLQVTLCTEGIILRIFPHSIKMN